MKPRAGMNTCNANVYDNEPAGGAQPKGRARPEYGGRWESKPGHAPRGGRMSRSCGKKKPAGGGDPTEGSCSKKANRESQRRKQKVANREKSRRAGNNGLETEWVTERWREQARSGEVGEALERRSRRRVNKLRWFLPTIHRKRSKKTWPGPKKQAKKKIKREWVVCLKAPNNVYLIVGDVKSDFPDHAETNPRHPRQCQTKNRQ